MTLVPHRRSTRNDMYADGMIDKTLAYMHEFIRVLFISTSISKSKLPLLCCHTISPRNYVFSFQCAPFSKSEHSVIDKMLNVTFFVFQLEIVSIRTLNKFCFEERFWTIQREAESVRYFGEGETGGQNLLKEVTISKVIAVLWMGRPHDTISTPSHISARPMTSQETPNQTGSSRKLRFHRFKVMPIRCSDQIEFRSWRPWLCLTLI